MKGIAGAVVGAALVGALGAWAIGCGGGSSGGGGGGTVTPTSTNPDPPTRLATETGTSAPSVALDKTRLYQFPIQPGAAFELTIDTSPSGAQVSVQVEEFSSTGSPITMVSGTTPVTTPFVTSVTASQGTKIRIQVRDDLQQSLSLSQVSARQTSAAFTPNSFRVALHVVGDAGDYAVSSGVYGTGDFNNLATATDRQNFGNDLMTRVNQILSPTGIQVDLANSVVINMPNSIVQGQEPGLIGSGGLSVIDNGAATGSASHPSRWGNLGVDSSDPNYGRALDIFVVVQAINGNRVAVNNGVVPDTDTAGVVLRQGGVFLGNGTRHSVVAAMFDGSGQPASQSQFAIDLAHEIGHFLSLYHPEELGVLGVAGNQATSDAVSEAFFQGIVTSESGLGFWHNEFYNGTPFSTLSDDKPGSTAGQLDADGSDDPLPSRSNVMFAPSLPGKSVWGAGQTAAMRSYLAITAH